MKQNLQGSKSLNLDAAKIVHLQHSTVPIKTKTVDTN